MQRKPLVMLLLGVGALLLVAAIVVAVLVATGTIKELPLIGRLSPVTKIPEFDMPPPASLADLAEEYPNIAGLLSDPELGTVYKEFLVAYEEGGIEAAEKLAQERGLLTPDGEHLRVTLVLDTEDSAALVAQLEGVGVEVVSVYKDRVNIAVAVGVIEEAMGAEDAEVVFSQLTELEHVIAVRMPETRTGERQSSSRLPYQGEGVEVMDADIWHDAGYTGAGIRIGVLDLGFDGYRSMLGDGLPDEVVIETFGWIDDEEVHGAACAEIVHDVAPDAELILAWYDGSDAAMGEAVDWLMDQNVDIITHSAGSVLSPRDGSGWDSRLVDQIVDQGVLWVNSAGNEADVHYRDVFTDEDGDGFHEFLSGDEILPVYVEGYVRVYLMWQESWTYPTQDYELLVIDEDGNLLASSEEPQDGGLGQEPAEFLVLETYDPVVYVAMYAYEVTQSVVFDVFVHGPGAWLPDSTPEYSVNSPGDALGALTVGAVDWDTDTLAFYSSQGPTTDERLKPEVSGPTKVSGSVYGQYGFTGTSASTPYIAGAAAVVWQAYPSFRRQEVMDFLLASVDDLGPNGPDTGYGFGRLRLPAPPGAAVIGPTPTPEPTTAPDEPTRTPAPLPTPTEFVYTAPEPVVESSSGDGLGSPLLLLALLVGGLGVGGGGLLLVGGILLVADARGRRQAQQPAPQPSSYAAQRPSPAPFDQRPAPARPAVAPPAPPAGRPAHGAPVDLPATQMWMEPQPGAQQPGSQRPGAQQYGAPAGEQTCAACGAPLRPGVRFCSKCGASVVPAQAQPQSRFCRACGTPIRAGSRFCAKCGTPVQD